MNLIIWLALAKTFATNDPASHTKFINWEQKSGYLSETMNFINLAKERSGTR
jgi:hypothetical protein